MRIQNELAMKGYPNLVSTLPDGDMTATNAPATTARANLANLTYDIKALILEGLIDNRSWKHSTTWQWEMRDAFGKRAVILPHQNRRTSRAGLTVASQSISRVCRSWYEITFDFFCRVVATNRLQTGWMPRHLSESATHHHTLTYVMTHKSLAR